MPIFRRRKKVKGDKEREEQIVRLEEAKRRLNALNHQLDMIRIRREGKWRPS